MDFNDLQNLYLGISKKQDASMKNDFKNRLSFFKNKGLSDKVIISANLVHKDRVVMVDKLTESQNILACDALITNNRQQLLSLTVADCLPIYFYDQEKQAIALAHAGWRGVVLNIAGRVVDKFIKHYQSNPENILVFIGPHIQKCHFEVNDDVSSQFAEKYLVKREDKIYIDLSQVVFDQLLSSGLSFRHVKISDDCTFCLDKDYFSYRRDKPEELETMIAYLGLK